MHVHPDLAVLRGRPAPQPLCEQALADWRALPQVEALRCGLAQIAAGAPVAAVPELCGLLDDHAAARGFVDRLIIPLMDAMRREPLAQLPFDHSAAPGMMRLRLIGEERACLMLTVLARRARRVSSSALFEDAAVHEVVVAGAGEAVVHRLTGDRVSSAAVMLAPGVRLTRDGPATARQMTEITRPLVLLQLCCEPAHPGPSREIAVPDGRVIQIISGSRQASQHMMALGVIGALGYRAGTGAMVQVARDQSRAPDLRWEALRQVLALDAARGLALLAELADDRDDALSVPADALRQRLTATHPELAALQAEPA